MKEETCKQQICIAVVLQLTTTDHGRVVSGNYFHNDQFFSNADETSCQITSTVVPTAMCTRQTNRSRMNGFGHHEGKNIMVQYKHSTNSQPGRGIYSVISYCSLFLVCLTIQYCESYWLMSAPHQRLPFWRLRIFIVSQWKNRPQSSSLILNLITTPD